MEWQQILGFYHVARLQSFTKAGEATFRTQSALSQQIKALEVELDAPLIERIARRKLQLTPTGERFFVFAESVLSQYDRLKEELTELNNEHKGRLRLAAPYTTLYHLFPAKVQEYINKFPQVELTLLDRPQDKVIQLVRDGDVDIGLVMESSVPADLMAIRWKRVDTVLMVPAGHPLTAKKRITIKQIAAYPLILPPRERSYRGRKDLEAHFQKAGLNYRVVMESSNVELTSVYVEMGLGISLATVVRDLPALRKRNLDFLPLDRYFQPDHIAVVMRKSGFVTSCRATFVSALLEGSAPPVPWPPS
jgi:DNA-binding transcriptional LysR family regulator